MENGTNIHKQVEIILKGVTGKKENLGIRKAELLKTFNGQIVAFADEVYVILSMIVEQEKDIIPDIEFLEMYLRVNRCKIERSPNVNIGKYTQFGEEGYLEFVTSVIKLYEEMSKEDVSDEEYLRALEYYKQEYIHIDTINILENGTRILGEGLKVKGKVLSGFNDMCNYVKTELLKVENLSNKTDRKGLITFGVNNKEDEEDSRVKLVTTFGIKELDKHLNIYEGDMVSVLAPSKGGKSRFVTKVLHTATVTHGQNVLMWSIENGYKGWEYLMRARHFTHFYIDGEVDVTNRYSITDDDIKKCKLDTKRRDMELASWEDLQTNTNYGKISTIDEEFNFETFLDVLDNAVNTTGAKLVCIDYLQLLTSSGKGKSKAEVIGDAYKQILQYLKRKKIAGIFPAQFKQTVLSSLGNKDEDELVNIELRDSAGESYEVVKTPDINLALYGTPEDIKNGSMKILSMPSRNSSTFAPINMYVDLGSCSFYSLGK